MKRGICFIIMIICMWSIPTFAGEWKLNKIGWWYQNTDGSYPINEWKWIDGNYDGIAECYYFDNRGYLLRDTITPDGFRVEYSGAWSVGGVIQTKKAPVFPRKPVNRSYINGTSGNAAEFHFSANEEKVFFSITNLNQEMVIDGVMTEVDKKTLRYRSYDGKWDIYLHWDFSNNRWPSFRVSGKAPYGMKEGELLGDEFYLVYNGIDEIF